MPALRAAASITRIPSGTTSLPIPSPSMTAIRYFFILPQKRYRNRSGGATVPLLVKKSNVESAFLAYAVLPRSLYIRRRSDSAGPREIDRQASYTNAVASGEFALARAEQAVSAGRTSDGRDNSGML